jgi:hypothetical protein
MRLLARWEGQVNRNDTQYKRLGYRLKSLEGDVIYFRANNGEGGSSERNGELIVRPAYNKVDMTRCGLGDVDVIKKSYTALRKVPVQIKVWAWKDEETKGKPQELMLDVVVPPEIGPDSEPGKPGRTSIAAGPVPLTSFISYAHEDVNIKNRLVRYLRALKDSGLVGIRHDSEILAGKEWLEEIKTYLNRAHIILMLISLDFLSSPFIETVELKRAVERHEAGEARVIPIIVRECDWKDYPGIAKLQTLPPSGKPISEYQNEDKWFTEVKTGLREVIGELMEQQRHT